MPPRTQDKFVKFLLMPIATFILSEDPTEPMSAHFHPARPLELKELQQIGKGLAMASKPLPSAPGPASAPTSAAESAAAADPLRKKYQSILQDTTRYIKKYLKAMEAYQTKLDSEDPAATSTLPSLVPTHASFTANDGTFNEALRYLHHPTLESTSIPAVLTSASSSTSAAAAASSQSAAAPWRGGIVVMPGGARVKKVAPKVKPQVFAPSYGRRSSLSSSPGPSTTSPEPDETTETTETDDVAQMRARGRTILQRAREFDEDNSIKTPVSVNTRSSSWLVELCRH